MHRLPTIFALSSAPGKAAVGLIRISGHHVPAIFKTLTLQKNISKPRLATLHKLYNPLKKGHLIDECLLLYFKAPRSFTGEDSLEISCHGGRAVINAIIDSIKSCGPAHDIRYAEPGEFIRRAFENGKLDLTAVEGTAALLDAETHMQHVLAIRQSSGELYNLYTQWAETIHDARVNFEAVIQFAEDDQIDDHSLDIVHTSLNSLKNDMHKHLNASIKAETLARGIRVAIVGPPNAGKSTLINLLTKRDTSIVSEVPGTTRDVIETTLDFGGFPIILSDTAGLRSSTSDIVEQEGMKRALRKLQESDIKVILITKCTSDDELYRIHGFLHESKSDEKPSTTLIVINKADLGSEAANDIKISIQNSNIFSSTKVMVMSCHSLEGFEAFTQCLLEIVKSSYGDSLYESSVVSTQHRQRQYLEESLQWIDKALVIAAEDLRYAANSLGKITGSIGVEELLGSIFSRFCIGK